MKLQTILDLRVTCPFYDDGRCDDLDIHPTPDTLALLARYGLHTRTGGARVQVMRAVPGGEAEISRRFKPKPSKETPPPPLPPWLPPMSLAFDLSVRDPRFLAVAEYGPYADFVQPKPVCGGTLHWRPGPRDVVAQIIQTLPGPGVVRDISFVERTLYRCYDIVQFDDLQDCTVTADFEGVLYDADDDIARRLKSRLGATRVRRWMSKEKLSVRAMSLTPFRLTVGHAHHDIPLPALDNVVAFEPEGVPAEMHIGPALYRAVILGSGVSSQRLPGAINIRRTTPFAAHRNGQSGELS